MTDFERKFRIAILNASPAFFEKIERAMASPLYQHQNDAIVGNLLRGAVSEVRELPVVDGEKG